MGSWRSASRACREGRLAGEGRHPVTIPEKLANRDLDASILAALDEPPERARVLIVGGGVIGSSIAYHLTRLGLTDVLVLERGRLTSGTTWHAAGLVSQVRGTHA